MPEGHTHTRCRMLQSWAGTQLHNPQKRSTTKNTTSNVCASQSRHNKLEILKQQPQGATKTDQHQTHAPGSLSAAHWDRQGRGEREGLVFD